MEWDTRDCFQAYKRASKLSIQPLMTILRDELVTSHQWPHDILELLVQHPPPTAEKLKYAQRWFIDRRDGAMAAALRYMIHCRRGAEYREHNCDSTLLPSDADHWAAFYSKQLQEIEELEMSQHDHFMGLHDQDVRQH